ncbi:tetratricopeptide repeat protein 23-like isoform X1 [Hyaena hyaena]|uniref:tetratricopeptide repeat protein 23-like isoform X1 n=1 Tax=Hyaena hyaena TaxID=95912 RepID=UPI0019249E49|nr:tetratricopeptide repeat protein 23-like isoform X1 [Hyaena hyaena]XP_039104179.1 tetratricopeptide repeat protein 23-like isoform X1 [Hyaena hyaena]XP_039104180.1 tetratricopeptide repeat protein 23-like isoform X1 [Hyaena hyaena]XP_039104181.1 tetratricopeptide repeat protein 23-like isoform X1 [Hyaena hyaena]XP_039104182.1 tetratricopeptide repeat protein 23-like isoform X1 [Hyaena hyaena]
MQASPIRIPSVSNDTDWDFCFHLSQQAKVPAYQQRDELYSSSGSGESEEDTEAMEEMAVGCMSLPKDKLAQSQKKITQLIKKKMNIQANKELIRCVILSRIIFGEEHWKCAQALASLAYGYLTLRGLPAQAKKHAESARTTLLTWKGNTTSRKEKKEILGTLVMLYYTVGVAWLLQNRGREAYFNLQKADKNMKELKELYKGSVRRLQVSEKDLTIALGRASLAVHRLNLALAYFEKAIGNVIAVKGDRASDLVSLYEEIAQIEQLRRNHDQAIQYLQQAYSVCVSLFTEVSPQTAEASALLAKAHALSGEAQHRDAVETYFIKSISAYQATLGPTDYETLATTEEFCKWLIQNGEKEEAYRLLKASLKSQVTTYGDCSEKVAETFYIMGRICFAKGELRKAIQLLRKCLMIQILLYGSEHSKSRDTKDLLTLMQRASSCSSRWRRQAIPGRRNCVYKGPEV